ncbi:Hsp33 protein [Paenibacillus sp. FSL R7-277]|uniref:Hsp33 family molecular chaperone HslO n=1 Tax=Paenibacillus sp. FSL R7-277 TaxID=1227352 RepID=UPI0003E25217|nr:Hsp33 family molecular chaperone HslO [Paenibacillus sp. FSL R7-277]ETT63326.1 Hsp33 protein [Paenibacillus sp. FSL R7-277]
MNNIIRMLSVNQDFRMAVADTRQIAAKALNTFTGTANMRSLLQEIITNCALFSSINDAPSKISFSFRLSQGVSIFCQITDAKFTMEYSAEIIKFDGTAADLFDFRSVVSITTGNWETGIHTSTVEAHMDSVVMLFSHFTVQSEQLPSHIILGEDNASRGILMQPLPFADNKLMGKAAYEVVHQVKELGQLPWVQIPGKLSYLAKVISENTIE